MERASSRGTSCLCRGDADEDVHATEKAGESHECDNLGNPRAPGASAALPGGGNPHVHKPGLLAETGRAPVPALLRFAAVAPPEAPGLRLELFYSGFTGDEARVPP